MKIYEYASKIISITYPRIKGISKLKNETNINGLG